MEFIVKCMVITCIVKSMLINCEVYGEAMEMFGGRLTVEVCVAGSAHYDTECGLR